MNTSVPLLVIGAGPFAANGQTCSQVEPLSLELYLRYAEWFLERKGLRPIPTMVHRLNHDDGEFAATLDDGSVVRAENVVVAVGLRYLAHMPAEITSLLPAESFAHTVDFVDLERMRDRRCLIVGGRQSAFEWAALLRDARAAAVHICYRHDTPAFELSDWSWIAPLVDRTRAAPDWYRRLPEPEKQAIGRRMWEQGRGKLEPWLWPRIDHDSIRLWPRTRVSACDRVDDGGLRVTLDGGQVFEVDQVILATGYKADIGRIPFLQGSNLWPTLRVRDGYPELDDRLQSNHEGLFFTGQTAVQDFGPFFGFAVAVPTAAERIGEALLMKAASNSPTRPTLSP